MRSALLAICMVTATAWNDHASAAVYVVPPDDVLIAKADVIVTASAVKTSEVSNAAGEVETITLFDVEELLKGRHSDQKLVLRIPGVSLSDSRVGVLRRVVSGAPRFTDGTRVLLFVNQVGPDTFAPTDFALGVFYFAKDVSGRSVLIRSEADISGWRTDGSSHSEPRRDATRFLRFVRGTVGHQGVINDYTVSPQALIESPFSSEREARPKDR